MSQIPCKYKSFYFASPSASGMFLFYSFLYGITPRSININLIFVYCIGILSITSNASLIYPENPHLRTLRLIRSIIHKQPDGSPPPICYTFNRIQIRIWSPRTVGAGSTTVNLLFLSIGEKIAFQTTRV